MSRNRKNYIKISPSKGRSLLMRDPDIILIDVRTHEEYAFENIPGSINIPLEVLEWQIFNLPINPYTPVMIYCKSGVRAALAASILIHMGFQTVYTLGGILNWPYETVGYAVW
jgi:phage shock protein E